MARKPTQQQVIDDLLNRYDPIIAQAFRQAVEDVRGSADLRRLIAALAAGDLNAALNALLTLAARDEMGFRMLLGREAVRGRFVVDPGRSYVVSQSRVSNATLKKPAKRKKRRSE